MTAKFLWVVRDFTLLLPYSSTLSLSPEPSSCGLWATYHVCYPEPMTLTPDFQTDDSQVPVGGARLLAAAGRRERPRHLLQGLTTPFLSSSLLLSRLELSHTKVYTP